jgi:hypothetical protein
MNKVPPVERDILTGGLTTACAGLWCQFLSEEHHWEGNTALSEYYERRSQELIGGPRGALHDRRLEEVIKRWKRM